MEINGAAEIQHKKLLGERQGGGTSRAIHRQDTQASAIECGVVNACTTEYRVRAFCRRNKNKKKKDDLGARNATQTAACLTSVKSSKQRMVRTWWFSPQVDRVETNWKGNKRMGRINATRTGINEDAQHTGRTFG